MLRLWTLVYYTGAIALDHGKLVFSTCNERMNQNLPLMSSCGQSVPRNLCRLHRDFSPLAFLELPLFGLFLFSSEVQ